MWWFAAGTITGVFLFGKSPGFCLAVALLLVLAFSCPASGRFFRFIFLAAGCVHGLVAVEQALERRLPLHQAGQVFTLSGRVTGLPEQERFITEQNKGRRSANAAGTGAGEMFRTRFVLSLASPTPDWPDGRQVVLTHVGHKLALVPGERLKVTARLRPPRGLVNDGSLDTERLALARRTDAHGRMESIIRREPGHAFVDKMRERVARRIRETVGGVAEAILPALVAGDRRWLSADHWGLLQRSGTAHLVAISGLHISLVAGAVWLIFRLLLAPILLPWPRAPTAATAAIFPALVAAAAYAAMAGFALPTLRALLMATVIMVALGTSIRAGFTRILGLVLAIVLAADPLAALESGFWLSFLAVAVLGVVMRGRGTAGQAQALLSLATGALAGWLFGTWSLWSAAVNAGLVPLYTLAVIPLALIGGLIDLEPALAIASRLVNLSWDLLDRTAEWPVLPVVPSLSAVLCLLVVLLRWGGGGVPGPFWPGLFLLLPWLWPPGDAPPTGGFDLVMFDVGQGQMSAIRTRHHFVLYDTGPRWRERSPVSAILEPWTARHALAPDLVFVSHGDDDHDGGVRDLARLWPGVPVFSGEPDRSGGAPCMAGQSWRLDGVEFQVLWPRSLPLRYGNNRSCVLRVRGAFGSVLLTGDIERPVEFLLAQRDLSADLLQVPHHGSGTSSSHVLIRAVYPMAATVGAGYLNRFGHPEPVLKRYRELGIPLFNTADTGMQRWPFREPVHVRPICWRQRSVWPWRVPIPVIEYPPEGGSCGE